MTRFCGRLALGQVVAALLFALLALPAEAAPPARDDVTLPVPVEAPQVTEPPGAVPLAADATVVADLDIDATGKVTAVVVQVSVDPLRDAAVRDTLLRWRFQPALRRGHPVPSKVRLPTTFPATRPVFVRPPPPPPPPEPLPQAVTPGEAPMDVTVRGLARHPNRGAADIDIDIGQLRAVPRQNAMELLKLAPGVLLTNEGGEGHAEQVFLRGFDARQGQDVAFSVAGVPVNESGNLHGNGYADLHFVVPELVHSVRVIEGPFDPRQGNYAVAGSAEYELGLDQPGLAMQVGRGSFDTTRALVLWRPQGRDAQNFAAAELYQTAGFGQNRDAQRATAMAQIAGDAGAAGLWRLGITAYTDKYHTAGVLREDDYLAGRKGFYDTYDATQGGNVSRYGLYATHETHEGAFAASNTAWLTWRTMRTRENFTGFLLDQQEPIQQLHGQRGDLIDRTTDVLTAGAHGFGRWRWTALDALQALELGYFARGDKAGGQSYRIEAATQAPYKLDTDIDATLGDLALYADLDLHLRRWLVLRGGVRGDAFSFDVLNKCAVQSVAHPSKTNPPGDASCLSQEGFGHYREPVQRASTSANAVLPRASLIVGPFENITASLSYGTGVRSIDPQYVTQDVATPFASAASWDLGLRYLDTFEGLRVSARTSLFQTTVDRDLVFSEAEGRNTLGGASLRRGVLADVRATGHWFDEAINATWVHATFSDTGLLIPYIPDLVLRSETAGRAEPPWVIFGDAVVLSGAIGVSYVGPRPLPQGERSDRIFTLDAHLAADWGAWRVSLRGQNLLDTQYRLGEYNYASDFHSQPSPTLVPARAFSAGAPRTVMLQLEFRMGGEP